MIPILFATTLPQSDINVITSLIDNVGFPIVACVFMAIYVTKQNKAHKEELSKMTDAVNAVKVAITALTEKLN